MEDNLIYKFFSSAVLRMALHPHPSSAPPIGNVLAERVRVVAGVMDGSPVGW